MNTQATQREGEDAAPQMGTAPISGPTSGPVPGPISGPVVVRRSGQGWQVGSEEAADLGSPVPPPPGPAGEADEAARLAVTVAQLEHALTARVRVEQAIGVLAERHRLQPRAAFDLLRNVARSRGQKVTGIAEAVVDSASNPLLPLPEGLARKQLPPRTRGRSPRHSRTGPYEGENVAVER